MTGQEQRPEHGRAGASVHEQQRALSAVHLGVHQHRVARQLDRHARRRRQRDALACPPEPLDEPAIRLGGHDDVGMVRRARLRQNHHDALGDEVGLRVVALIGVHVDDPHERECDRHLVFSVLLLGDGESLVEIGLRLRCLRQRQVRRRKPGVVQTHHRMIRDDVSLEDDKGPLELRDGSGGLELELKVRERRS